MGGVSQTDVGEDRRVVLDVGCAGAVEVEREESSREQGAEKEGGDERDEEEKGLGPGR